MHSFHNYNYNYDARDFFAALILIQIAKVLLCNQTAWSRNGKTGPMLVVCYTNHALDQFLEGILDFHPNGIIRVGGRSQSERIKELSLSTVKKEMIQVAITTGFCLFVFVFLS